MVGPKALLDPDLSTRDKGKARSSRSLHKGGGVGVGGQFPPKKIFSALGDVHVGQEPEVEIRTCL